MEKQQEEHNHLQVNADWSVVPNKMLGWAIGGILSVLLGFIINLNQNVEKLVIKQAVQDNQIENFIKANASKDESIKDEIKRVENSLNEKIADVNLRISIIDNNKSSLYKK